MKRTRRGVVLVAVLVALLVVMLISATIVRGLVVQHRLATAESTRAQAFWFAESAVQRARTQLEANPDYEGETWRVTIATGSGESGEAVIRIKPVANESNWRTIVVEARYPDDPVAGSLEERSLVVQLDHPGVES
ncbi:MAG: general secretion pathway protein GspK [Planctomycetaceae bacterium]|nr:general secretion pathway protein GspK [Planctomycetales bacterium]MCB9922875.1 general secretion pathway protein GspK [Planctomycetaceae bacterium]